MELSHSIPAIDVSGLFQENEARRSQVDAAILSAATSDGFFVARGLSGEFAMGSPVRAPLLRIFELPEADKRALWRNKFEPKNPNVYRGWFPTQFGQPTFKEGIDIGPDVLYGASVTSGDDPLRERTPLPSELSLPGWQAHAANYYAAMKALSGAFMQSIARSLKLPQHYFDSAFGGGISTLRLLRYPLRPDADQAGSEGSRIEHGGEMRSLVGAPHVDSGFLTLLAQDGVSGLQVEHLCGEWIDVLPEEGTLAVNFGRILERWTDGRIKATPHRVLGSARERRSIAFFYETSADARISPLPIDPPDAFEPFVYGDFLWKSISQFAEFHGVARRSAASAGFG